MFFVFREDAARARAANEARGCLANAWKRKVFVAGARYMISRDYGLRIDLICSELFVKVKDKLSNRSITLKFYFSFSIYHYLLRGCVFERSGLYWVLPKKIFFNIYDFDLILTEKSLE